MSIQLIKATEAARSFSEVLNKVCYQGQTFAVQRGNTVVANISPPSPAPKLKASDLAKFLEDLPSLDAEDRKEFSKDMKHIRAGMKLPKSLWD